MGLLKQQFESTERTNHYISDSLLSRCDKIMIPTESVRVNAVAPIWFILPNEENEASILLGITHIRQLALE